MPLPVDYDAQIAADRNFGVYVRAALIGAICAALIGLASAFYIVHTVTHDVRTQVEHATLKAAQNNCLTQQQARDSGNRVRFALRELLRFDTDIITVSAGSRDQTPAQKRQLAQFLAIENGHLQADYQAAQRSTPGLPPIKTFADLYPLLANAPRVGSCSSAALLAK